MGAGGQRRRRPTESERAWEALVTATTEDSPRARAYPAGSVPDRGAPQLRLEVEEALGHREVEAVRLREL